MFARAYVDVCVYTCTCALCELMPHTHTHTHTHAQRQLIGHSLNEPTFLRTDKVNLFPLLFQDLEHVENSRAKRCIENVDKVSIRHYTCMNECACVCVYVCVCVTAEMAKKTLCMTQLHHHLNQGTNDGDAREL